MATKDNFNKALFDMFGVGNEPQPEEEIPVGAAAPAAPAVRRAAVPAAPSLRDSNTTYIAPGSLMEGTLRAKGNVEIAGDFKGDMIADGNVIVHANVESNITAARLELISCKLTGDIHSSELVVIDESSVVSGSVYASDLSCAGHIKGDLEISGNATFHQSARVEGNIVTETMTMERGAIISGGLTMKGSTPQARSAVKPTQAASAAGSPAERK